MDLNRNGFGFPVTNPLAEASSPSAASANPSTTKAPAAAPEDANRKLRRERLSMRGTTVEEFEMGLRASTALAVVRIVRFCGGDQQGRFFGV